MQRTTTATAFVVLTPAGIAISTIAGTHSPDGSIHGAVPVYDLHVMPPGMKAQPVQAAPRP